MFLPVYDVASPPPQSLSLFLSLLPSPPVCAAAYYLDALLPLRSGHKGTVKEVLAGRFGVLPCVCVCALTANRLYRATYADRQQKIHSPPPPSPSAPLSVRTNLSSPTSISFRATIFSPPPPPPPFLPRGVAFDKKVRPARACQSKLSVGLFAPCCFIQHAAPPLLAGGGPFRGTSGSLVWKPNIAS